jgi:flagellar hook-associated protein 3 FlgL
MSRVSTVGLYSSAVLAITTAQDRLATATQQANTGKVAQDLSGYGADSEKIIAQRSLQSRIQSHIQNGTVLSSRLDLQDQALQSVSTAAGDAHNAIAQALASGDGSALMTQLQSALSTASTALNTRFNGQYIFAGSQTTTAPVSASQMSDLTAAGAIANVFHNDQLATANRLDDNTVVTTGQLADSVGTPLMTALQSVEAFNQGASGPISGTLTAAQTTFLQGVLANFSTAQSQATSDAVQNGAVQQQLKSTTSVLNAQNDTLTNSLSDLTDVNEAQAANDLQLAQFAFQASARVFNSLQNSSLLSILPIA